VLYTKVDAQCDDKLAMGVGRTKLTVDVPWWNFSKSRVWDKVPEGCTLIFGGIRIPLRLGLQCKAKIRSAVACDGQTDGHTHQARLYTNLMCEVPCLQCRVRMHAVVVSSKTLV